MDNVNDAGANPVDSTTSQNENNTVSEVKKPLLKRFEKTFKLSDESDCVVRRAKAKHSLKAAEMAMILYGKSPSGVQVMHCIISLVTTINGEGVAPDVLDELWAEDYALIQESYMELSGGF